MKHSVYSRMIWICSVLAVISALALAAPAMKTGVRNRQKVLVVGERVNATATKGHRDISGIKRIKLNTLDKISLFKEGGFVVLDGIMTKARFTSTQPCIARQGNIMAWHSNIWRTDDPMNSNTLGFIEMPEGDGYIDLVFYPFEANKPTLIVFNIDTGKKETAFELMAGDQTQKLALQSGNHNISCIVVPTSTKWQEVTLLCKSGSWWAFNSVEVVVQK